jgi:hypothetical protein
LSFFIAKELKKWPKLEVNVVDLDVGEVIAAEAVEIVEEDADVVIKVRHIQYINSYHSSV